MNLALAGYARNSVILMVMAAALHAGCGSTDSPEAGGAGAGGPDDAGTEAAASGGTTGSGGVAGAAGVSAGGGTAGNAGAGGMSSGGGAGSTNTGGAAGGGAAGGAAGGAEVYFADDYEGTSLSGGKLVGWEGLTEHPLVSGYYFNNSGGPQYAFQELRMDPAGSGRTVLYAQVLDDDPSVGGTTRAQATLNFKDSTALAVYHTSHRMYLSPDFAEFTQYPEGIYWFVLFEIWAAHNDSWDGDVAGSARWDLAVRKEPGVGQPLYWTLHGEAMQPQSEEYKLFWPRQANHVDPIPMGKWFTLEVYFKPGEGAQGRIIVTTTIDGEQPRVLFDVADTTSYPGHPELTVHAWQAYKLYFADPMLDWMRDRGKDLYAYYNDFAWYKQ
jgi:hypothetical protein